MQGKSGIYCITNLRNGKRYIGQSIDIERRWKQHKDTAMKGVNLSLLHKALREQGEDNFKFEVLCYCPEDMLTQSERYYILLLKTLSKDTYPGGYNVVLPEGTDNPTFTNEEVSLPSLDRSVGQDVPQELEVVAYCLAHTKMTYSEIATQVGVTEEQVIDIDEGYAVKFDRYDYPIRGSRLSKARRTARQEGIKTFFTEQELEDMLADPERYDELLRRKCATDMDVLYWSRYYAEQES